MLKLINEDTLYTPNGSMLLFYILDTSDFVVDILNYNELIQVLQTGQIKVEHMHFHPSRGITGAKIVQGLVPSRFKHWSVHGKMALLNLQKQGGCLEISNESSCFYATSPSPYEEDLDTECAKLINFTTMRNQHHKFNLYGDFYMIADAKGFFHLIYRNITSKLELKFPIDIRQVAPECMLLYKNDKSNIVSSGGFSNVAVFQLSKGSTEGTLCVDVLGTDNKGVGYKISLPELQRAVRKYIEIGTSIPNMWKSYVTQQ